MDRIGREKMAKIGNPIAFMVAAVAVTIFALPTLMSAATGWYMFLTIVIMLVALIAILILSRNKN
jgi:low affinity Fe/Cu permease